MLLGNDLAYFAVSYGRTRFTRLSACCPEYGVFCATTKLTENNELIGSTNKLHNFLKIATASK
jgi:hypothetical protein